MLFEADGADDVSTAGRRLLHNRLGWSKRLTNATSTARWAREAVHKAPLGTCNLPPAVYVSRCGTTIRYIRSHPVRHNLRTGIRFHCASSIFRFLVACRPEAGCVKPAADQRWYRGTEVLNCNERAMLKHEQQPKQQARADPSFAETTTTERHGGRSHLWARHECTRLSEMPPEPDGAEVHEPRAGRNRGGDRKAKRPRRRGDGAVGSL